MTTLPNRTNIYSALMIQMLAFGVLCHFGLFSEISAAQKFYPNGRYGRRSVLPALMPSIDSEDVITFIGNVAPTSSSSNYNNKLMKPILNSDQPITLFCFLMGRTDLLRCALRESSSDGLDRSNNESQQ